MIPTGSLTTDPGNILRLCTHVFNKYILLNDVNQWLQVVYLLLQIEYFFTAAQKLKAEQFRK